jgi:PAS domain S-box-containing protein
MSPVNHVNDKERLEAVASTGLLDSPAEEAFDRLTQLAAKLTGAPVTFITLVDESRDFYKSCVGFPEPLASQREMRGTTFCHYAIQASEPLIINDTRAHPVYRDVPTVKSLGVAAYLGIPLTTPDGQTIGSFCAIDFQPREWREVDVELMQELAASTMREISLREAQKKLAEERRLLETTIQQMPAGVMIATPDGKVILANTRATEILGRRIEDIAEEGERAERWPLTRALRQGEFVDEESFAITTQTGGTRHIMVSAAPVVDGTVLAGVITMRDVTEARLAAEERDRLLQSLDEERSRLRTLLEQVPAGVLFAEAPSGRIVLGNRWIQEILGHDVLPSSNIDAYADWVGFHPDGRRVQGHEWPLARALQGEVVRGDEFLYQRGDGRRTWIGVHGAPVRDAGGNIVGGIVAIFDTDERRRLAIENEGLYEEARRANQAKDDFFAAVTHELRTPMTSIIGWSRLLQAEAVDNPDAIEAAQMIESSARVQARLVDDLLDISRIAAGKITLSRESLDVNEVIDEALRAAEPAAFGQGIRMRSNASPLPAVHADRARLRQIFGNLLSNAIKFTPSGGLIEITSAVVDGVVELGVRDTGRGIPPDLLPKIFDRGSQARHAEQGGLGLGLTIVRHLIEMHGGSIVAESEGAGRGATFRFTLPAS